MGCCSKAVTITHAQYLMGVIWGYLIDRWFRIGLLTLCPPIVWDVVMLPTCGFKRANLLTQGWLHYAAVTHFITSTIRNIKIINKKPRKNQRNKDLKGLFVKIVEVIYVLTQEHYSYKKMVCLHESHPHSKCSCPLKSFKWASPYESKTKEHSLYQD